MFSYYKDAEAKGRVNESIQDESGYPRHRTTSTWVKQAKQIYAWYKNWPQEFDQSNAQSERSDSKKYRAYTKTKY